MLFWTHYDLILNTWLHFLSYYFPLRYKADTWKIWTYSIIFELVYIPLNSKTRLLQNCPLECINTSSKIASLQLNWDLVFVHTISGVPLLLYLEVSPIWVIIGNFHYKVPLWSPYLFQVRPTRSNIIANTITLIFPSTDRDTYIKFKHSV